MTGTGRLLRERTYYSVGGGFVVDDDAIGADRIADRHHFGTPSLRHCRRAARHLRTRRHLPISDVMLTNELSWRAEDEVRAGLLDLWQVMVDCVTAGCCNEGVLPGGLKVPRRAPGMARELARRAAHPDRRTDPFDAMDWVNLFALAVNEENAAGGRIVTAPTNGAAGIIPAVLHYWVRFVAEPSGMTDEAIRDGIVRFLLTAAAIGMLFKQNASISGAEVGCQGEVGSACAMAAGGLCEVLGGNPSRSKTPPRSGSSTTWA